MTSAQMTGSVRTAGVVLNTHRPVARKLAESVISQLHTAGVKVRIPVLDARDSTFAELASAPEDFAHGLDIAISLGGDGTMLRTVDLVCGEGVPVLGVNMGHLGYLAEVEPSDVDTALRRVLSGDYSVAERMLIEVRVEGSNETAGKWYVLNEAVLEKQHSGRLVRVAVWINGAFFATYAADGLIIATPTGSTAYSFSNRGPIISPTQRCMLLTPISPHMLFDRSLVFGPHEVLRFEVQDERPVSLLLDGRELGELEPGGVVTCTQAPQPARLVTFATRDFHQVLRTKFGLPDERGA